MQVVIIVLLFFLEFLRMIGVERLIKLLLSPFLKLMKIGDRASTIAVVGVTLGLGFGGGVADLDVLLAQFINAMYLVYCVLSIYYIRFLKIRLL